MVILYSNTPYFYNYRCFYYWKYFINGIKIIKGIAFHHEQKIKYSPIYHFFVDAADAYFQDREELNEVGHYNYLEKMKKLQAKLESEPDYEKRLSKLNALANKWCEALKDVPIENIFKD